MTSSLRRLNPILLIRILCFKTNFVPLIPEPGHSARALPERALPGRQQTCDCGAEPRSLGGQEGVDEGRTSQPAEAYV